MSDLVETLARQMFEREWTSFTGVLQSKWGANGDEEYWLDSARASLAFIEKAGHRIVPVEPTEEMRLAGFAADFDGQPLIRPIWSAMLAAAPKVTP